MSRRRRRGSRLDDEPDRDAGKGGAQQAPVQQDPSADVVDHLEWLHALDARQVDPSRAGAVHRAVLRAGLRAGRDAGQSAVAAAAAGLLSVFVAVDVDVSDFVSVVVLADSEEVDEPRLSVR